LKRLLLSGLHHRRIPRTEVPEFRAKFKTGDLFTIDRRHNLSAGFSAADQLLHLIAARNRETRADYRRDHKRFGFH
jgi:hypothetical protein